MEHVMGSMAVSSDPSSVREYRATSKFRRATKIGKKDKKSILEIRPPLYVDAKQIL